MSEKPKVRLVGEDGNAFAIAGRCSTALRRAGQPEKAKELTRRMFDCANYNEMLRLMAEYVDIE